jgi:hypothetical protein
LANRETQGSEDFRLRRFFAACRTARGAEQVAIRVKPETDEVGDIAREKLPMDLTLSWVLMVSFTSERLGLFILTPSDAS